MPPRTANTPRSVTWSSGGSRFGEPAGERFYRRLVAGPEADDAVEKRFRRRDLLAERRRGRDDDHPFSFEQATEHTEAALGRGPEGRLHIIWNRIARREEHDLVVGKEGAALVDQRLGPLRMLHRHEHRPLRRPEEVGDKHRVGRAGQTPRKGDVRLVRQPFRHRGQGRGGPLF